MKFAYWSILSLIIWFFIGNLLAASKEYQKAFQRMNDQIVLDWFMQNVEKHPLVSLWLLGLCFFALLVATSFIFCTTTTLLKLPASKRNYLRSLLLLVMHILFVFILGFHFFSMITGVRAGHVKAFKNESFDFEKAFSIKIRDIHFVDDVKILQKSDKHSKIRLFADSFSIDKNYAEIELYKDAKLLHTGKAYYLKPLVYNNIRVTIEEFTGEDERGKGVGVILTFALNPFVYTFFTLYACSILILLLYSIISWRTPVKIAKQKIINQNI